MVFVLGMVAMTSLYLQKDHKMSKGHGHHTELRNKSAVVYISFQHILLIPVLPPPALLSAAEHQNSISSPIVFSRRATRSPYPTSTPHNMLARQPLTPGDAAAWNWPVDGGSRVHVHGANRSFLIILLARTESPFRKMNRRSRSRS